MDEIIYISFVGTDRDDTLTGKNLIFLRRSKIFPYCKSAIPHSLKEIKSILDRSFYSIV